MPLSPTRQEEHPPDDEDTRSTGPIIVPVPVITRETRIVPVMPVIVTPPPVEPRVIVEPPEVDDNPRPTVPMRAIEPRKTIPPPAQNNSGPTIPNNSGKNSEEFRTIPERAETIPPPAQNTPAPSALNMPDVEDESEVGRKRKYDDEGIYGDISIRDLILTRHITGRHFPDLSADMRAWYEWMYFTPPVEGEHPFRGKSYEQHERAYKRGQQWIASHASAQAVGHHGATITQLYPKRASS